RGRWSQHTPYHRQRRQSAWRRCPRTSPRAAQYSGVRPVLQNARAQSAMNKNLLAEQGHETSPRCVQAYHTSGNAYVSSLVQCVVYMQWVTNLCSDPKHVLTYPAKLTGVTAAHST